jgi:uncharacterized protein (TIGR02996 family)
VTYLTHPDFNRATHAALLAACAASRADDLPRLVYADFLEEWGGGHGEMECERCDKGWLPKTGTPDYGMVSRCPACSGSGRVPTGAAERAEFVRVQCELAATVEPPAYHPAMAEEECSRHNGTWARIASLRKRERELLLRGHTEFLLPEIPGLNRMADIRDIDTGETHHAGWTNTNGDGGVFITADFRRGFVHTVRGPLAALLEHLPGLGAELGLVERAEAVGLEPHESIYTRNWYWFDEAGRFPEFRGHLPRDLFEKLWELYPAHRIRDRAGRLVVFTAGDDARDALSAAILAVCMGRAGLAEPVDPLPASGLP